jgi:uncharacterized protein (DUF302 family)
MQQHPFTFSTRLPRAELAAYRPGVEAAMKAEGFGVPTEMDVRAIVRDKLGVERRPFLILGGCNPALSHRVLELAPEAGALLPCNVVLRDDGDAVVVEMVDPRAMLGLVGDNPALADIAEDARERLLRALAAIETQFGAAG